MQKYKVFWGVFVYLSADLRGVPEGGVEQAAEGLVGVGGHLLGGEAEQRREGDELCAAPALSRRAPCRCDMRRVQYATD
jgi:hypothetical protein